MRGYFAIGAERISKPLNVGNLVRSAHAFGASFFFTVSAPVRAADFRSDTSKAETHLPIYEWAGPDDMRLPKGCRLVGVELTDDAIELPSFRHPLQAAYVLGPERGSLSPDMVSRCDYVVKIPTAFCINVAMAGAIVMYDRAVSLGRAAPRPVGEGGPSEAKPEHVFGPSFRRTGKPEV
ncbi:MAG: RNA methyltransferase [Hyphomicrobiales bacterium]|nr:RNA methyltransferase [Hyphomicrobiales bacterium]